MDVLTHMGAYAFCGMLWLPNAALGFGLLVGPRRTLAFLSRGLSKGRNWLGLLGLVILGNTFFAVLTSLMTSMYARDFATMAGMAR